MSGMFIDGHSEYSISIRNSM